MIIKINDNYEVNIKEGKVYSTRYNREIGAPDNNGYIYVSLPYKGKKTTIRRARLIWELMYGEIPTGFQVHHRNRVVYDDRIENLVCVSMREHFDKFHKGENAGLYGKSRNISDEQREAQRQRMQGKQYALGRKHTEEAKKKISQSNLGKRHTEEAKRRMSEAHMGRTHTEETKKRLRQANSKQVAAYKDGKLIFTYPSVKDASKDGYVMSNISRSARGIIKTYKGYKWIYSKNPPQTLAS